MLLSDMRSRVANSIGLDNTNGGLEQGLIDGWTNDGCVEFLERTKVKVEQFEMSLIAGDGDYELPAAIIVVNDVIVTSADGQVVPLEPMSMEELLWRRRYPGAEPVRYYAFSGANLLSVYPTPTSPETMDIYGVPFPTTLTAPGDDITAKTGIPAVFLPIVEIYVKWKAAEYNDNAASQNFMQQYEQKVVKARGRIRRIQGRRRPPAIAGRPTRRKLYPTFPGQDTGV